MGHEMVKCSSCGEWIGTKKVKPGNYYCSKCEDRRQAAMKAIRQARIARPIILRSDVKPVPLQDKENVKIVV